MNRDELLRVLRGLAASEDPEEAHGDADEALLAYINDPKITAAFVAIKKWYA